VLAAAAAPPPPLLLPSAACYVDASMDSADGDLGSVGKHSELAIHGEVHSCIIYD
jgi:hypothetical protein